MVKAIDGYLVEGVQTTLENLYLNTRLSDQEILIPIL
jgi:hypothetical protein